MTIKNIESGAQGLDQLRTAVFSAIDGVADDGTGGEAPIIGDTGNEDDDEQTPPAGEGDEGDEGGEGAAGEEGDGDGAADDKGKVTEGVTPPPAEPSKESPSASVTDESAKVKEMLSYLDEGTINGIKKYIPGGDLTKVTTLAELREATRKHSDHYWESQRRLADLAGKGKPKEGEEPPATDPIGKGKPATEVDPELRPFDDRLQTLQTKGKDALAQHEGWKAEIAKRTAEAQRLRRLKNTEDYDESAYAAALEAVEEARSEADGWMSTFRGFAEQNKEVRSQRALTESLVNARKAQERQATEANQSALAKATKAYNESFDSNLTRFTTDLKVPAEDVPELREQIAIALHREAVSGSPVSIDKLPTVVEDAVKKHMAILQREREKTKRETLEQYTKEKSGDAPKKPGTKKRVAAETRSKGKGGVSTLDDLHDRVMGNEAWDEAEG
jgi:hypothetical protein